MTATSPELLTRDLTLLALSQRHKETLRQTRVLQRIEDGIYPHRETRKREYTRARGRTEDEWDEVSRIEREIAATPANTFAGLVVKLRIGVSNQRFKVDLDFTEDQLLLDERCLMAALADAERLAGGVI